ncbi:MAG: GLPGLI family protein [Saprospiraceae bacterium]|nr:GLPGLI family protein [Saprospiraceae bacterium]
MTNIKTSVLITLSVLFIQFTIAQTSGVITYQETMKLDIQLDDAPGGIDLSGMLPTSTSSVKQLIFDQDISKYVDAGESDGDQEISSDDGSIQIVMQMSEVDNVLYSDFENNLRVEQRGFMGKSFVIEKEIPKMKWKITPEKIKYLDYECMKATHTDEEGREVVAWFAPALRIKAGPASYGNLPGAILMLSVGDQETEIKATKIEMKKVEKIEKPEDGKKVTEEEYEQIVEDKMKEMEKEHGGRTITIRG